MAEAESKFAALTADICDSIEKEKMSPKEGDAYFTLLYLIMDDSFPDLKLSQEMDGILFEGMRLHDYGKDYGANLNAMRILAKRILGRGDSRIQQD